MKFRTYQSYVQVAHICSLDWKKYYRGLLRQLLIIRSFDSWREYNAHLRHTCIRVLRVTLFPGWHETQHMHENEDRLSRLGGLHRWKSITRYVLSEKHDKKSMYEPFLGV